MGRMHKRFRFPAPTRCWFVPAFLVIVAVSGCALAPSVQIQAPPPSTVGADLMRAEASEVEHSQKFAGWIAQFRTSVRAAGIFYDCYIDNNAGTLVNYGAH